MLYPDIENFDTQKIEERKTYLLISNFTQRPIEKPQMVDIKFNEAGDMRVKDADFIDDYKYECVKSPFDDQTFFAIVEDSAFSFGRHILMHDEGIVLLERLPEQDEKAFLDSLGNYLSFEVLDAQSTRLFIEQVRIKGRNLYLSAAEPDEEHAVQLHA